MIYFVSDVHLGSGDRRSASAVESRFVAWLDEVSHDATEIWLLGDIFDFWFEFRGVVPRGFVRTLGKLAELADKGIKIVFVTGNHDMWTRDYFSAEIGAEVYNKPITACAAGKKILAAHGDNMALGKGDFWLKAMNAGFRSRFVRFVFTLLFPKNLIMWMGHKWSGKSRRRHTKQADPEVLESLRRYAVGYAKENDVDYCIFGHFHLADDSVTDGVRVVFLSDWQVDNNPVYAVLDDDGELSLKEYKR